MQESQPRREGFLSALRRFICRLLCCEPQPQRKDKPIAFEPGKLIVMAEYPPGLELTPTQIRDRIAARITSLKLDPPLDINFAPERVIVLRSPQRTLATITGDVPAARQSPLLLLNFVSQLHRAIALPPLIPPRPSDGGPIGVQNSPNDKPGTDSDPGQSPDTGSPASNAGATQAARATDHAPAMLTAATPTRPSSADTEGFDLRAASPNWLSSGAKYIGGGGPGAWPIGITSVTPNPTGLQPWDFVLPPVFQSPELNPHPVEVAILDTVPDILALESAHGAWVGNGPTLPPLYDPNPLLTKLLAGPSGGPFNVVNQSSTNAVSPPEQLDVLYQTGPSIIPVNVLQHPYPMPSHGLFVAGIIRSIAPQAKLRLIQVLNDDGGGSVESITQGLMLADRPNRSVPLVINCSFTLRIPRPGEDLAEIFGADLDEATAQDLNATPGNTLQDKINFLTQLMHDAFVHVCQSPAVAIIAAAGNNEVVPAVGHPQTRYPAAFEGVSGVAALAKDDLNPLTPDLLATYSDLADDQLNEGFAAFGGDVAAGPVPLKADAANGMLGVFIDQLPETLLTGDVTLTPNISGWARWSGTSFSAPVISAILANLISRNNTTPLVARQLLGINAPDIDVNNAVSARQFT
ncbi:MAG: S8/S53 family peptidase [Roseiflexaceae bacterium]